MEVFIVLYHGKSSLQEAPLESNLRGVMVYLLCCLGFYRVLQHLNLVCIALLICLSEFWH